MHTAQFISQFNVFPWWRRARCSLCLAGSSHIAWTTVTITRDPSASNRRVA